MRLWLLVFTGACLACAGETRSTEVLETPLETPPLAQRDVPPSLQEISMAAMEKVGSAIGSVREARFLRDGRRVLVLDRYAPFLRLFSRAGDSIWAGGREGGGPREFLEPQTLALTDDGILIFQAGRVSLWGLDVDSLFFKESIPLPLNLIPFGAVSSCQGDLLLYARDGEQILSERSVAQHPPPVDYLFVAPVPINANGIRPIWSDDREQPSVLFLAHSGLLLSRNREHIVVLHRRSQRAAGEYLEFDCSGALLRRFPEIELAAGGTVPVKDPRTRAQEWPMGVVALPDGFVALQQRYYSKRIFGEDAKRWRTEFFLFRKGVFQASILVDEQWLLLDIDPYENLLLGGAAPVPHFAVVPLSTVFSRLEPNSD